MIFGEKKSGMAYTPRVGVYAIILNETNEQILLIKHLKGYYFLPGGGIEGQESHEQCLKRELLEETGFATSMGRFIGEAKKYHLAYGVTPTLNHAYFYVAKLLGKVQEPSETDVEAVWLPVTKCQELLFHEHQAWGVQQYDLISKKRRL